jgi:cell division initiation protein
MASTDLDLPLLPSAEQIRRREFATIRRGYDPDQVREYLGQIATQVETLERELREAREASDATIVRVPEPAEDPYEALASRLASLIRAADEQARAIIEDARAEAALTLQESRAEADRIRVDAQARAEEARQEGQETLREARIEAERLLSGLSARRETLVAQLHEMQTRLMDAAKDLGTALGDVPPEEGAAPERGAHVIDPRYEDLWASTDTVTIDLESLDADPTEDEEDAPG